MYLEINEIGSLDKIAIYIKQYPDTQRHVGILYSDTNDNMMLIHLAWHYQIKNEPISEKVNWVKSNLNDTVKKQLCAYISMIGEHPPCIPYGFGDYIQSLNSENGQYLKVEGMTCATFVLAIFNAQGINLIDTFNWPQREEDVQWQESIMKTLESYFRNKNIQDQEHLDKMNDTIGSIRIRPEEVAGSFGVDSKKWPVESDDAICRGKKIINELNENISI